MGFWIKSEWRDRIGREVILRLSCQPDVDLSVIVLDVQDSEGHEWVGCSKLGFFPAALLEFQGYASVEAKITPKVTS